PTTPLAAENTAYTATSPGVVYRLRLNIGIAGSALPAAVQTFKLQYATSAGGPWTDIGAIGSGEVWRGYNNTTPADGATITSLLLSTSNVAESYEEANPSVANPNSIPAGQRGEWDWVLEDYGAANGTTYYFRMVKGDGTGLDTYTGYPQLTAVSALTLDQDTYRWYQNANALNPTTPLATENTAYTATTPSQVYRLRMNLEVAGQTLSTSSQAFKLQYATGVGGPWTDVDAIGGAGVWRGYNNATPADGATITSLLLSNSNVLESYEEQNPSVANPNAITVGQRGEWDWALHNNGAAPSTAYYFRAVKGSGAALDTYTRYSQLTTPAALTFSQDAYRWYQNANAITPTTSLAAENTAYSPATWTTVYRLRMNVWVTGTALSTGSQAFKLQYATSTGGPWTDADAMAGSGAWRGYNNAGPTDGATITSLLLSTSNVLESYEEQNPSVANPNAINVGQRGEWDWELQHNGASPSTAYYFR
ncbi:MAG: hypothetical protein AAB270_08360, partial [Chloroflexota bacterium]